MRSMAKTYRIAICSAPLANMIHHLISLMKPFKETTRLPSCQARGTRDNPTRHIQGLRCGTWVGSVEFSHNQILEVLQVLPIKVAKLLQRRIL